MTKVDIRVGKYLAPYWGYLYPSWLWELKEQREEEERERLRQKDGKTILPDFWNIRLEVAGTTEGKNKCSTYIPF